MKSVVEYFYETYGFVIQHTQWPCLQVGNTQRPNYLPMEVNILLNYLLLAVLLSVLPLVVALIACLGYRYAKLWKGRDILKG